ncbi:hypothetical protein QRX50_34595 [Amycolatopsis carbonis]|uniref:Uncharacterized protein n=1 Tax=Amycolatopsis carbonis TaxID=715471 RepID=A0A9Y2ICQ1_9PSEU|nr:hypothetical protein [Amycolatopsis sp. 2-15]WIX76566.1 hypothetical protein QRX50_34595 [Amycolatopsis sp. 2-15]
MTQAREGNDVKLWRDDQTRELHGELISPARGGIEHGSWAACEFPGMPEQISIRTLLAPDRPQWSVRDRPQRRSVPTRQPS